MKSALLTISSKQLLEFLPTYKGTVLTTIGKFPAHFSLREEHANQSLSREYKYQDFK